MTTIEGPRPPGHSKAVRLATAAYHHALARQWRTATAYVQRISDECGGQGLHLALLVWSDAYFDHATDGAPGRAERRGMSFIQGDTGQLDGEDSDRVPERVRWAGKLLAARASRDDEAWQQLLDEMPTEPFEIGGYVGAVLETVTETTNGLPRGFAVMGQPASRAERRGNWVHPRNPSADFGGFRDRNQPS